MGREDAPRPAGILGSGTVNVWERLEANQSSAIVKRLITFGRTLSRPNQTCYDKSSFEVIVAKNRNGPLGSAWLRMTPETSLFAEIEDRDHMGLER